MTTARIPRDPGVALFARTDGADDPRAPALVLTQPAGLDLTIWDGVLPHLPPGLRILRWDARGHGRSSVPPGPYRMGQLVSDAEAVCDFIGIRDAVILGAGEGGLVAQGLAVKRLDLIRGLILSGTAARLATPAIWAARAARAREGGMAAVADDLVPRWLSRDATPQAPAWRDLLLACDPEGYAATCDAMAGADFYTPTSGLRLPTLGLAGAEDGVTPPDLVRETTELVPGAAFHLLRRRGHLPMLEDPAGYATTVTGFLHGIGHLR